jgi:hypothetical protein
VCSDVPEPLRGYTRGDVANRKETWQSQKWAKAFAARRDLFDEASAHFNAVGGISRSYVHEFAAEHDDPVALFLLTMAWGFAQVNYGPSRTLAILAQERAEDKITHIVNKVRSDGAGAGWDALLGSHRIKHLNVAFGTKLLYFAGYHHSGPYAQPLILDDRVRWSLYDLKRGTVPPPGSTSQVKKDHYLRYLDLAQRWADDPTWQQEPDVVEFGLFDLNGKYRTAVVIPPQR